MDADNECISRGTWVLSKFLFVDSTPQVRRMSADVRERTPRMFNQMMASMPPSMGNWMGDWGGYEGDWSGDWDYSEGPGSYLAAGQDRRQKINLC